jgi:LAO/AO transport system kinase
MEALARSPDAYIRPSPSGGALGGLAPRTREAMLVCEAAGFDTILVETVGVGQSETEVDNIVDVFTLLVSPGGGDELQGMKRGVMELADLVVVTKADGDLLPAARQAAADYRHALHLFRPKHASVQAEVLTCSAIKGDGIPELWTALVAMHGKLEASGELAQIRAEQSSAWLWVEVRERLVAELRARPGIEELVRDLEDRVRAGTLTPTAAAEELLRARE